jgi:lipoate-protein ligase A
MICIYLDSTDPFFNLAADEYLLKNSTQEFLLIYINDKSVVIGKHQVAHRETDTRFVSENNIPVIRRISGGGTVFHDKGNLNFSFILNSEQGKQVNFRKYSAPVIDFLSSVGIQAKLEGKSDLKVDGLKISGNAEHIFRNRVLHHGTLLYDADLRLLKSSIRNDKGNYITRAVSSNPSSVTNLNNVLKNVLKNVFKNVDTIDGFKSEMLYWFLNNYPGTEQGYLSEYDSNSIGSLARSRYSTWDWNYGYGPEYHFTGSFYHSESRSFFNMYVKDGIISEFSTDGSGEAETVLKKLVGCRHMPGDIKVVIEKENILDQKIDIYSFF